MIIWKKSEFTTSANINKDWEMWGEGKVEDCVLKRSFPSWLWELVHVKKKMAFEILKDKHQRK